MITIDIHEPAQAQSIISQAVPCTVEDLNTKGWADYRWQDYKGEYIHVERKTWGELLTDLNHVEDQLRRHINDKPDARLIFLLEGMVVPAAYGTTIIKPTNRDNVFVKGHGSSIRLGLVYPWLYQVEKFVEIYTTPNYEATCIALVAFYKGDQKEKHETLHRHIKKMEFHVNPQVVSLMGLLPNIGPKRAEALIDRFITVWNVVSVSPEELSQVDGIGKTLSKTILRQVGRTDV